MSDQVYVMTTRDPTPQVKIGVSGNPRRRLKDLNTSRVDLLHYHAAVGFPNRQSAMAAERFAHLMLRPHRARSEMFNIDPRLATAVVVASRVYAMPGDELPFSVYLSLRSNEMPEQLDLDLIRQPDGTYG